MIEQLGLRLGGRPSRGESERRRERESGTGPPHVTAECPLQACCHGFCAGSAPRSLHAACTHVRVRGAGSGGLMGQGGGGIGGPVWSYSHRTEVAATETERQQTAGRVWTDLRTDRSKD